MLQLTFIFAVVVNSLAAIELNDSHSLGINSPGQCEAAGLPTSLTADLTPYIAGYLAPRWMPAPLTTSCEVRFVDVDKAPIVSNATHCEVNADKAVVTVLEEVLDENDGLNQTEHRVSGVLKRWRRMDAIEETRRFSLRLAFLCSIAVIVLTAYLELEEMDETAVCELVNIFGVGGWCDVESDIPESETCDILQLHKRRPTRVRFAAKHVERVELELTKVADVAELDERFNIDKSFVREAFFVRAKFSAPEQIANPNNCLLYVHYKSSCGRRFSLHAADFNGMAVEADDFVEIDPEKLHWAFGFNVFNNEALATEDNQTCAEIHKISVHFADSEAASHFVNKQKAVFKILRKTPPLSPAAVSTSIDGNFAASLLDVVVARNDCAMVGKKMSTLRSLKKALKTNIRGVAAALRKTSLPSVATVSKTFASKKSTSAPLPLTEINETMMDSTEC